MDDHEREVRRLRLAARDQLLEVEQAEAELASSQTVLIDLLCDWAAQGQWLRIDAVDRTRLGRVVHVGESVITIEAEAGQREVIVLAQVEGITSTSAPTARSGRPGTVARSDSTGPDWSRGHPRSLIAHLRSLVGDAAPITVERRTTGSVAGRVIGVAETHAVLGRASGTDCIVPLEAIVSVMTNR